MALAKYWSCLATSFSSSFPKHSSSMIGLYDLGAVGSFLLGFLSITMRACRHRVGWYPWSRQALRSEVSLLGKDLKTCLTIGQVIPDGPGADVGDTKAKACLTSSSVRGEFFFFFFFLIYLLGASAQVYMAIAPPSSLPTKDWEYWGTLHSSATYCIATKCCGLTAMVEEPSACAGLGPASEVMGQG